MGTKYFSTGHKTTGNFSYSIQGHCNYTGDSGGRTSNTITSTIYAAVTLRSRAKKVDKNVSVSLGGSGWKTALSWHEDKTGQGGVAAQSKRGTAHPSETLSNTDTTVTLYAKATGGTSGTFGKTKIDSVTVPKMKQYKIDYQKGSADSGSVSDQTKYHGDSIKLRDNQYKKQGFHFIGWRDVTHGDNYSENGKYKKNANATMNPRFEENTYTVKYDGNKGSGSTNISGTVASQTCYYNNTYTYKAIGFSRVGYTVKSSWYTAASGGSARTPGASFSKLTATHGGTITLYAQWTPKPYTLTYYANRTYTYANVAAFTDNNQTKTQTINFDSTFTYLAANNLKFIQRYNFDSWNTRADGGGTTYRASASQKWTTDGNRTLYAQWIDLYEPPRFTEKDPISTNVFRSDSAGIQSDADTNLHINEIQFIPTKIRNTYYPTKLEVYYRIARSLKPESGQLEIGWIKAVETDPTTLQTVNPNTEFSLTQRTLTNINLSLDYAYDIRFTLRGLAQNNLCDEYVTHVYTTIPAGAIPFDIRRDQQMVGFSAVSPSARQGVALGHSYSFKKRDLYVDVNSKYSKDELLLNKASTLGGIQNYFNPSSSSKAVMELRDDGDLTSFGYQIPNHLTNSKYYGIILNNGENSPCDIYFDLNDSTIDKDFVKSFNESCFDNLTYTAATAPDTNSVAGITFHRDGLITSFGKEITTEKCAGHNLPDEYIELEYLQATGTQYINTGVIATANTTAEVDFKFVSHTSGVEEEVLAFYIDASNRFQCGIMSNNALHNAGGFGYDSYVLKDRIIARGLCIGSGADTAPLYMFGQGQVSTVAHYSGTKNIYSCKIKDGSTWLRYFVPAKRASDDVLGMYDIINDVFYTNNGTGNFIGGAELNNIGWFIPKGNINSLGMPESRDVFIQDDELDNLAVALKGSAILEEYGTISIARDSEHGGQKSYAYDLSMTWQDWINSPYNTDEYLIDGNQNIVSSDADAGTLTSLIDLSTPTSTDIISGGAYTLSNEGIVKFIITGITNSATGSYFISAAGMPFTSWITLPANTRNFQTDGTYVYLLSSTHYDASITTDANGIETVTPGYTINTYTYLTYNGSRVSALSSPVSAIADSETKYATETVTTRVNDSVVGSGDTGSGDIEE